MSITILKGGREPRKIAVYDLEWIPETYELRLAGFFDGESYRHFTDIGKFLSAVLIPKYAGYWLYAHAGGLADMHFVLQKLATRSDIKVNAVFSGSSAIIVKVRWNKHIYTFIDSYWLLRDKLAHLAPYTGIAKGRDSWKCASYPACGHVGRACADAPTCGCPVGPEPLCMFRAPLAILRDYNERDCKILHKAVSLFQEAVADMGADLRSTIASTALGLFRTKYLSQRIETHAGMNDVLRTAYIASRVEVFRSILDVQPGDPVVNYYDFNSMFPTAMMHPLPAEHLGSCRTIPEGSTLYFAECTVSVPDMFLPPLGARGKDGRIFFPTGTWRGNFARADLELLAEFGGRIEKVHVVEKFHSFMDLSHYAQDLYERRAAAKKNKQPFLALVLKYLLNSCYGKFAEKRAKTELVMHPDTEHCPHDGKHDVWTDMGMVSTCVEPLFPGAILVSEEKDVPHEHVAISATITAIARGMLYRPLASCDEDLYYCDTDSLLTSQMLPTGDKLGELKLEHTVTRGRFVQPKLYEIDGKVKSKGFSRLTPEQFQDLIDGREVQVERMYRVKEMARELKMFGPKGKSFGKKMRFGMSRPKRQSDGRGGTRPWTYQEIQERWKP